MTRLARSTSLLSIATLAAGALLAGCGGDPFLGTWRSTTLFGIAPPADVTNAYTDITFRGDGTFDVFVTGTSAATAMQYAGCTSVLRITNGAYSRTTSGTPLTLTVSAGSSTVTEERSGCSNATDNETQRATTALALPATPSVSTYTLSGDTMTITGMGTGAINLTLTRR